MQLPPLLFEINTLGVRSVMRTNMLQNVRNVVNRCWMKFSMLWENHGILPDVLYAKYALLSCDVNSRNVDEISEMKDFLLIQSTTSQCVNPVSTLDLFDKWKKLKHEESRRSSICYRRYLWSSLNSGVLHVHFVRHKILFFVVTPNPNFPTPVNTNVIS